MHQEANHPVPDDEISTFFFVEIAVEEISWQDLIFSRRFTHGFGVTIPTPAVRRAWMGPQYEVHIVCSDPSFGTRFSGDQTFR